MKINLKRKTETLCVLLIVIMTVLMSKTIYFGVINRSLYQYLYYALVIIGLLVFRIKKNTILKAIIAIAPLLILMLMNILINSDDLKGDAINTVLGQGSFILCAVCVAIYLRQEIYAKCYLEIISIICIVSLVCFLIANVNSELALSFCQVDYNWNVDYGYSWFYTWGWNGQIFTRNSGPFWEAGAFQGFIIVAILFLLYNIDGGLIKRRRQIFILYVITLLTTQSSTGYIIAIILFLTHWNKMQGLFGNINKSVRYFIVLLIVLLTIYIIVSTGNISAKFSNANTNSMAIRFGDMLGGLLMIKDGGIIGFGVTFLSDKYKLLLGINVNDSVGLFSMIYTYGLIFGAYYIYCMCKGIKKLFRLRIGMEGAAVIIIFIILHMTEDLWCLPNYLTIMYIGLLKSNDYIYKDTVNEQLRKDQI